MTLKRLWVFDKANLQNPQKGETLPETDPTGEYKTLAEALINADDGEN